MADKQRVCNTLYLGQPGSVGAGGLISCRILLKISIEHATVLPCVMIPMEFNKDRVGFFVRDRHTDMYRYTEIDAGTDSQHSQSLGLTQRTEDTGHTKERIQT